MDPVCNCGHFKEQHVYQSGACRPGFKCLSECNGFESQGSQKPPTLDDIRHYTPPAIFSELKAIRSELTALQEASRFGPSAQQLIEKNSEMQELRAANAKLTAENTNMRENKFERGDLWNSHQALQAEVAQLTKERDGALIMRDAWQQRHEELKRSKLALRLSELGRLEARVKRYREALQALSDSLSVVGGKFNGFRREPKCMMDYGWPGHIGLEEGDAISLAISQTREALADEPRTGDEGKGA